MARALAVGCLLPTVYSLRSEEKFVSELEADADEGAAEQLAVAGGGVEVNFNFMTNDFRYPTHEAGFFGTMKEWFGGRAVSDDVKEEIVVGHTCAKRGDRDETYYGTSYCYWLPDISYSTKMAPQDCGLSWVGGQYKKKSMCGTLRAEGKCLRSSVCHNNARDGGDLDKEAFIEEIELPAGCLKESAIKARCDQEYDASAADLKREVGRCKEVEGRFNAASSRLAQLQAALSGLPQVINHDLPMEIERVRVRVEELERSLRRAERDTQHRRSDMHSQCQDYQSKKGYLPFMNMMLGATPTEQILSSSSFSCYRPWAPTDNGDGKYWDDYLRYQNQVALYDACKRCDDAKRRLESAARDERSASQRLYSARGRIPQLQQEIATKERELRQWQSEQSGIEQREAMARDEWSPQYEGCHTSYREYRDGKSNALDACAPRFYDESCEKQCVERLATTGCAVLEGSEDGDAAHMGGLQVQCQPPQPSWIKTPYSYKQIDIQGATMAQCERIAFHQPVQRAQHIIKAGWLWKKGRVGGWDKRYFVLESGDAVRSAVLRYFSKDPSEATDAEERGAKGIILRDARGVNTKKGRHYNFKDGSECFKLYHFYRDYRLCVPGDVPIVTKSATPAADERDDWVELLKEVIGK